MSKILKIKAGFASVALAAALSTTAMVAVPTAAHAQSTKDQKVIILSLGRGQQVNLGTAITDVVITNPGVADVELKSNRQLYIYGKGPGETSVIATDAAGRTVYSATIRVGTNLETLDQMLGVAMPDADIDVTTMNGVIMLTGTVQQPEESAEAFDLITAFSGGQGKVINRIKTATPLQINLQVRVAEVSRSLSKEITGNFRGGDSGIDSGGQPYFFGLGRGRDITNANGQVTFPETSNIVAGIGRLFGVDVEAALDMAERNGLTSTLANPNLTTVSGETGEFLAGGRFPIVTSSNNGVSVQYETYGISLTYTPIVLSDGRISLRLRTEVSDISDQGAVRLNGLSVPATTTRMAETTVELGSGQSMMIAGLMNNQLSSSVDKTPGLGDVPVLGALFKSNGWRRNETELMIVVTPYLVKPVSDSQIRLPTDGINSIDDAQRIIMGKVLDKAKSTERPMPTIAPAPATGPEMGSVSDAAPVIPARAAKATAQASAAGPGFSFDN
jgi:pilus assembly protein CpaC